MTSGTFLAGGLGGTLNGFLTEGFGLFAVAPAGTGGPMFPSCYFAKSYFPATYFPSGTTTSTLQIGDLTPTPDDKMIIF